MSFIQNIDLAVFVLQGKEVAFVKSKKFRIEVSISDLPGWKKGHSKFKFKH